MRVHNCTKFPESLKVHFIFVMSIQLTIKYRGKIKATKPFWFILYVTWTHVWVWHLILPKTSTSFQYKRQTYTYLVTRNHQVRLTFQLRSCALVLFPLRQIFKRLVWIAWLHLYILVKAEGNSIYSTGQNGVYPFAIQSNIQCINRSRK